MKNVKIRRIMVVCVLLLLNVCLAINVINLPELHVKDGAVRKEISLFFMPINMDPMADDSAEESKKTSAWDSEMPEFVWRDLEYAKKHDYKVEYKFGSNLMKFRYDEEKWTVDIRTCSNTEADWENISMYKNKENELVLYGYDPLYEWFEKITLGQNSAHLEVVSYDANIPLVGFKMEDSLDTFKIDGMSIIRKFETFYFFKKGESIAVSSQDFPHGKIKQVDMDHALIETEDETVYAMYVKLRDNKPVLDFVYVGQVDSVVDSRYYYTMESGGRENYIFLPTVIKDGKYCAIVPNNWDTYAKFSLSKATNNYLARIEPEEASLDYSMKFEELKENVKEIAFRYYRIRIRSWEAQITFELNGKLCTYYYGINGYDTAVILPKDMVELFDGKVVTSFDEMWETIDGIRKAYFDCYENGGDFVPAVFSS